MPLATAQSFAWTLSRTLMTIVLLIRTDKGFFAMPSEEFDGDPAQIVREYDPFAR
ncbi:hypothetical protein [Sphingomonas sp. OTU376]|uniref:hypothetical protein n=1 Tax=Sphingomonas sp. OTU376 TaxID=3043863 RepID=UPI00313E9CAF